MRLTADRLLPSGGSPQWRIIDSNGGNEESKWRRFTTLPINQSMERIVSAKIRFQQMPYVRASVAVSDDASSIAQEQRRRRQWKRVSCAGHSLFITHIFTVNQKFLQYVLVSYLFFGTDCMQSASVMNWDVAAKYIYVRLIIHTYLSFKE